MGVNATTFILSKKYTDETAAQFGGLKGAPCKIKSITKQNGQNIVTFEWTNDEGEIRSSTMYVEDGTPIYNWNAGDTYHYGDLVIYESNFYRCTVENSDFIFDSTHWAEIGSPDGNYDIVQSVDSLPPRFTAADRKMYYVINEFCFYLWDGSRWVNQKKFASYNEVGLVQIDEETLSIDENGVLSIRTITNEAIETLFEE